MATNTAIELSYYFIVLKRCSDRLSCSYCNKSILPKHFENHVSKKHGINGKTCCVWCQEVSWPSGEKYKHKKHLITCFKKYIGPKRNHTNIISDNRPSCSKNHVRFQNHNIRLIDNVDPYRLLDMTHEFPEKDFFGHQLTYPDFEEVIWPIQNLPPLSISFADDNLNLAASCVLLYLTDTFDFFHVMVKSHTMKLFVRAMDEDEGRSRTLPFSHWCDGGEYVNPEYRQHRHLIVVSPKNHFKRNVWAKVKLSNEERPPIPNYLCKKLTFIESPLHLVNAIGYLSHRHSQCECSVFENETVNTHNNHFYIYKTLPVHFKLHLVLLWKGGLDEYMWRTKFQNVSVARLAEGVLTHDGLRWSQKIKDFYGHERGMVIHVAKDFVPVKNVKTPYFLHLTGDKVLYFKRSPENEKLDPELWLRKQVEGGNCFYDVVEECTWIPRPRDQKILNFYKPAVDKIRELELKNAEQEKRITDLEAKVEMMEHYYTT